MENASLETTNWKRLELTFRYLPSPIGQGRSEGLNTLGIREGKNTISTSSGSCPVGLNSSAATMVTEWPNATKPRAKEQIIVSEMESRFLMTPFSGVESMRLSMSMFMFCCFE